MSNLIVGIQPVLEAVKLNGFLNTDVLFLARQKDDPRIQNILHKAKKAEVKIEIKNYAALDAISPDTKHQGIILQRTEKIVIPELMKEEIFQHKRYKVFIVIDSLNDPQNLGSILRTALAFEVDGIILPKHDIPPLGATVLKTSAGALLQTKILRVGGIPAFLLEAHKNEIPILGTSLDGEEFTQAVADDYKKQNTSVLLVIGNEEKGLSRLTSERCDRLIRLRQSNQIQSLNVANATSVFLYLLQK